MAATLHQWTAGSFHGTTQTLTFAPAELKDLIVREDKNGKMLMERLILKRNDLRE